MIRVPHPRPCRIPSFRADISDQLTKFYFSSIPLLPPLMEKTYPLQMFLFLLSSSFGIGPRRPRRSLPPTGPCPPVSAVRRKYSLHGSCHKKKARTKRYLPGVSLHAGSRKTLFFKSAHLPLLSKLLVLLCAQKTECLSSVLVCPVVFSLLLS